MRTHGMASNPCHRPNLTHSTTSAFRPTGMPPQVPLQQHLVSPISSSHDQYRQQRLVPCVDNGKHAMQQLDVQQRLHHQQEQQQRLYHQQKQQQEQQRMFHNMSGTNPVNTYQDISIGVHQRSAPTATVQPAASGQYPHAMQQYSNDQSARERESLHQELRLLHAVHYQDMNRKDEILETYWNKKLGVEKKHGLQTADAHHTLFNRQRNPQVLQDPTVVLRQRLVGESQMFGQKVQRVCMPSPEELYKAKNRVSLSSAMSPTHPQMASYAQTQSQINLQTQPQINPQTHSQTHPRHHTRFEGSVHQRVPQLHILHGSKESPLSANNFAARSDTCHNYQMRDESYEAQQQYQARFTGHEVLMDQHPVHHTHQEVYHCSRTQTYYPSQPVNASHPLMQQQLRKQQMQYNQKMFSGPAESQQGAGPSQTQEQLQKQMQQLRQERMFSEQTAHMSTLKDQLTKNRTNEDEDKKKYVETDSTQGMRLSKMAVSIKEEQIQLKEVLEKSLHRAAIQGMNREVKEVVNDDAKHVVPSSASDMESMPRIVEVRSLAKQEFSGAVATQPSGPSKAHPNPVGDVLGMRHSKPKSLMIKAHQEFQEVPTSTNRVPSIGSMDSDNGRKDSWDSGIESPPWPENREASAMNVKRPASLPCEDSSSLGYPHKSQKNKLLEKKQSDTSLVTTGLELCAKGCAKDQSNFPTQRIPLKKEQSTTNKGNAICSTFQEAFQRSRHFSMDEGEKRISERPVAPVNRKRSWPGNDLCPVDAKVVGKGPQNSEHSQFKEEWLFGQDAQSKEGISPKSQQMKSVPVENEIPLDLSCKKESGVTISKVMEMKETKLEENEVRIEEKPNLHEFKEDPGEIKSEVKKEKASDEGDEKETSAKSSTSDGNATPSTENQMQVYFGDIMMRALKRLWSESKLNLEGNDTSNPKPEFVESSDDDSGKYFQPSSVTTLKHIPQVDSPDGSHLPQEDDREKKMLPSSCSALSLETTLCELMHHSSDAFKHGGDIFQHFDKIIKRELMIEIEKQSPKCNNEPKVADTKKEADPLATQSSDISPDKPSLDKPSEQTSEAVALCDEAPSNISCADEEIDESQDLVIVESSISPKPSPDSQASETKLEQNYQIPVVISSSCPVRTSVTFPADSSVNRISSKASAKSARTEAQETAHQAAQEAARLAAEKAAARATKSASADVYKAQEQTKGNSLGVVSNVQKASDKPSASNMPSSVVLPGWRENHKLDLQHLHPNRKACLNFATQSHQSCLQPLQYMGENVPFTIERDEGVRKPQFVVGIERRNSEPALLSHSSTESTQKGMPQRMHSEDASQPVSIKNVQNAAASTGTTFHIIPQTLWQTQTQQQSDVSKVKLIKVSCNNAIQIQAPSSVSCVPNAQAIQRQLQKSPIVLLDKLVCVPGQTYPQAAPVVGTQMYQTGKAVLLPKEAKQYADNNSIQSAQAVPSGSVAIQRSSVSPSHSPAPDNSQSPELIDYVSGPFRIIRKTTAEPPTSNKKPFVSAFIIIYKNISLPGVLRSGVPFVPPRMVQDGMFPDESFEEFCHALQDCNIMQRYMTVLERTALLNDLKRNKISSCKLVSLEEFHQKYDNIKVLMDMNKLT